MMKEQRFLSRLTLKIFAVNGVALVILAFGLIYLGQYENNLVQSELKTLERQARIYAGAIAEAAQVEGPILMKGERGVRILRYDRLAQYPARKMIKRLGQTTTSRIRLYDFDGTLMGDSDWLSGPVGVIDMGPTSSADNFFEKPVEQSLDFILYLLPSSLKLDPYPNTNQTALTGYLYPDVQKAMDGTISAMPWLDDDKSLILSAAVPVKNMDRVMGVVYLTRDGGQIENTIMQMKRDVLSLFFAALGITFLLSLYLSGAIARPLKKLAAAANNVERNFGRGATIPNLSKRNDEIGDLSLSLRTMTDALSARLDAIERFAADVAHELKNPLTSLRSAVETVAIIKNDDDRTRLMGVILHDVERLDRLISDISKSSRLDAELSREDMDVFCMRTMITDICDHYHATANLPVNDAICIRGVESRMGQVFDNLLSNAKSFSDEVTVIVEKQGQKWHIAVEDNGPGIPENKLETIFSRFYTERPQGEDFGNHSGLGLAICKQIIAAHEGQIYAENRYDSNGKIIGARFIIILKAILA
jgi:two-component system, OmpR family, sensor histidine kinase ChvG